MNTKLQVLVIDDDAVVGRSFDRVLSGKGYQVVTALSGEEAMDTMSKRDFDIVFTDIRMPGMDGLEVTKSIKARCPWTPVVVITGYGTEENESRASVLGASGFVRKPLTPEMIESITLKAVSEAEKHPAPIASDEEVIVAAKPADVRKNTRTLAKTITMTFAAPFIALAYVIALPFIGFYQIAKLAIEAYAKKHPTAAGKLRIAGRFVKNVGLFLVSPFIALAYVIALPFVGFFMFTKLALEAHAKRQLNA
ncbi:MAG TPA: response regulator [Xanthomonadales bacterium]